TLADVLERYSKRAAGLHHHRLAVALGSLAGIGFGVLVDAVPDAIVILTGIGFHGKAQRVAVDLLQQSGAHAEGDVFSRPALVLEPAENEADGFRRHPVALDNANRGV